MKNMKNMKNKELLVEINRIKKMMGLLTEGIIDDGTRKLLQSLGYSNEWIDNLANKSVSDINFSNVADVLASSGIRSYDNLVANASEAFSKQTTEITADEIFAYLIKLNPDFIESINKKIALSANEAANNILKNTDIKKLISDVDPTMAESLKGLLDAPLTGPLSKSTNQLNNGLSFVRNLISAISSKGKTVPDDLINLEKQFTDKIAEQDKLKVNINLKIKNAKSILDANDPQSYLKGLSEEQLISKLNSYGTLCPKTGWYTFGPGFRAQEMSGWKFHVFGETLEDSAFLIEKLKPISDKYNATSKVGGLKHTAYSDSMKPGGLQHGKSGVCMYIPTNVIENGKQQDMLMDIQAAISGYKKGGAIRGDQAITPSIHYRYELDGPIKVGDIKDHPDYLARYAPNQNGPYKPSNVDDIFQPKINVSDVYKENRGLYDEYLKDSFNNNGNEDAMYDWFKTLPDDQMNDIYKYIEEKKLIYKENRGLYDEYLKQSFNNNGNEDAMYDWFKTLPDDQMNDIYKYIEEIKLSRGNKSNNVNLNNNQPPNQQPNQPKSPYERYGAGSN